MQETLTLESVLSEPLAPRLPPGRYYHLFLIHHPSDSQWAHGFIDRLEMPAFGFRCCCVDRDVPERLPRDDVLHYGAQLACKVTFTLLIQELIVIDNFSVRDIIMVTSYNCLLLIDRL